MEQIEKDDMIIDLKNIFNNLLDHMLIILLSAVILAFGAGFISKLFLDPVYASSAKLYVISREDNNKSMTLTDLQTGTQLTKDYQILIKSRSVMEQVISDMGMDINYDQLAKMITVNAPVDTRIIEITVSNKNAYTAKLLADTVARVSAEKMVKFMETEKVNVIEQGNLPTQPSKPNILIYCLVAGVAGAFLASGIIILMDLFDDSIKTAEDIERYLGMATLCEVPKMERKEIKKHSGKHRFVRNLFHKKSHGTGTKYKRNSKLGIEKIFESISYRINQVYRKVIKRKAR